MTETFTIQRRHQVEARTGLARSTIYRRMKQGRFPKPLSLGGGAVGWDSRDIDRWLEGLVKKS